VLLSIALFCVFGFLASFEPGNGWLWKAGYGALGCGCLTGAVALLRRPLALALAAVALLAVALCSLSVFNQVPWLVGCGALAYGYLIGIVAFLHRPLAPTLAGAALLASAMFGVFGFMESSFSLPGKVGYGALGCGCIIGAAAFLRSKAERSRLPGTGPQPVRRLQTLPDGCAPPAAQATNLTR